MQPDPSSHNQTVDDAREFLRLVGPKTREEIDQIALVAKQLLDVADLDDLSAVEAKITTKAKVIGWINADLRAACADPDLNGVPPRLIEFTITDAGSDSDYSKTIRARMKLEVDAVEQEVRVDYVPSIPETMVSDCPSAEAEAVAEKIVALFFVDHAMDPEDWENMP